MLHADDGAFDYGGENDFTEVSTVAAVVGFDSLLRICIRI